MWTSSFDAMNLTGIRGGVGCGIIRTICCSVPRSCLTLCDPMDCSTPGFPYLHYLPKLAQTHVHWVIDAIQAIHPLSLTSGYMQFHSVANLESLYSMHQDQRSGQEKTQRTIYRTTKDHETQDYSWGGEHEYNISATFKFHNPLFTSPPLPPIMNG